MRLEKHQIQVLIESTHLHFGNNASIWLFGSRTDDEKHGGDIDLYIETDLENGIVDAKLKMRSSIWPAFGDQKIDILVRSRKQEMSPMHQTAKGSGLELKPNR